MTPHEELFVLAQNLKETASQLDSDDINRPLRALENAAERIARSFSGSWQGYHSRVYHADFSPPSPGEHFSQEWGLIDMSVTSLGSRGDWREYDADYVKEHIRELAGTPDLSIASKAAESASKTFDYAKSQILSVLHNELDEHSDSFLEKLKVDIEKLTPLPSSKFVQYLAPKGQIMTRDMVVVGQGVQIPPHISIIAEINSIRNVFVICNTARDIATKAASHLERKAGRRKATERVGTNVFIGHGRSPIWRDLKDFIQDRLNLPWDEFNRVPAAGVTNIARLSEMLDAAAIGFLVMTAEDERADGGLQARMNVVHEAGLFQGRLGFSRAIVMLEEGCEQFSNIDGLGQIRFPRGNISSVFEHIRQVLEREGLIEQA